MKKIFLLFALFSIFSCQYDDMWIKEEFDDLDNRINNLEALCDELNDEITSLSQIVDAIDDNEFITDFSPIVENGEEIGYKILFESGREIVIYNGKDGKDGENGYVPEIGVSQDTDGIWYWTVDGEWLRDSNGDKLSTTGREDLIPKLKIEDMFWYVSYDGGKSWEKLDKAVGGDGVSFFEQVSSDEDNVYVTLADGTVLTLPKASAFSLNLFVSDDIPCIPYQTLSIPYVLDGVDEGADIITIAEGEWVAEIVAESSSTGEILITAPENVEEGQVVVVASYGSKTIVKALTFTEGSFVSKDSFILSEEGGEFVVSLSTNYDYEIAVDASWIEYLETKAIRFEDVVFGYEPIPEGTMTRKASITFTDRFCGVIKTIEVLQGNPLSLDKQSLMMVAEEEEQLTATLLLPDQELIWTSSDSDVAWVSQEGKVYAMSEGTAVISVMTSDYVYSATCEVEVKDISDLIYLEYGSATNVSYSGGYVHAGTQLSWYFNNYSTQPVLVKSLQIIDATGTSSNVMAVDEIVDPGSYSGWVITLGTSYVAPKCKAVYEYKGREYSCVCGHMFN